jgi:hypothetical protein
VGLHKIEFNNIFGLLPSLACDNSHLEHVERFDERRKAHQPVLDLANQLYTK